MGKNSKISWTHHTFNPWWGCTKIMSGCQHCYAEVLANRFGLAWGGQNLRLFGDKHWNEPLRWNREAERDGTRARVFCGSMCDVGELREGKAGKSQDEARERLWKLIEATPHLDWLLLTKRPHNLGEVLPWKEPRRGVWIGASASTQADLDRVAPELLRIPAAVRFLSLEPLLEKVSLDSNLGGTRWIGGRRGCDGTHHGIGTPDCPRQLHHHHDDRCRKGIDWVITGCESGPNARPMDPEWAESILKQCQAAGVPWFFKQAMYRGELSHEPPMWGRTWQQMPEVKP